MSKKTLLLTDPLPNADNPIVAFMGASGGGKKAVFAVFAGARHAASANASRAPTKCNFVYLKKGDVEFFEVTGTDGSVTTYELDLEKIGIKAVSSPPHTRPGRTIAASPPAGAPAHRRPALRPGRSPLVKH